MPLDSARSSYGFVLTDALAALFVLATAAGGIVGAFAISARESQSANFTATALHLAVECLEGEASSNQWLATEAGAVYQMRRARVKRSSDGSPKVPLVRTICSASWKGVTGTLQVLELERIDVA